MFLNRESEELGPEFFCLITYKALVGIGRGVVGWVGLFFVKIRKEIHTFVSALGKIIP